MRHTTTILLIGLMLSAAATPALAQRRRAPTRPARPTLTPRARVPSAGMVGIGGSIGVTVPTSAYLDKGLEVAGSVETYLTPRLSIRGQVGTAWWDIVGLRYAGSLQPVFVLGNVVYNWEQGKWHPYATGGGGAYRYAFDEAAVKGSATKGGIDLGGGIEYFFTRSATITGEALFHKVGNVRTPRATLGYKGSFWSITGGVKKYF